MGGARIKAENLSSGYFGKPVLYDLNFDLQEKGIYVVLGHNGAGKTTLFRTVAGILRPLGGRVTVDTGMSSNGPQGLTYLAHMDGIPDGMRVSEALRFYSTVLGCTDEDVRRVVQYLGISDLTGNWFNPLSEGQRKKVALARSLLRRTPVNVLDEPTANLDPGIAMNIRNYVREISKDSIVLYSSHNLYEANDIGKFVMLIKDGRLVALEEVGKLARGKLEIEIRAEGDVQGIIDCTKEGDGYRLKVEDPQEVPQIVKRLADAGILVREVKEIGNPLEDLYSELEK